MNQACPILQMGRYIIWLICKWNWAFLEERKSTGVIGRNNSFISITVFSKSLEAEIETEFRLIAQPYSSVELSALGNVTANHVKESHF